jgi:hypothetical protein
MAFPEIGCKIHLKLENTGDPQQPFLCKRSSIWLKIVLESSVALFRRKVNFYYSMEAQSGANGQRLGESIVNFIGSRDTIHRLVGFLKKGPA